MARRPEESAILFGERRRISAFLVLICLVFPAAFAQQGAGSEWQTLDQEVTELYGAGKYGRALAVAKKAVEVAEKEFGPEHPNLAASLNNLAALYRLEGQYAQAEPLDKRALAITEKALGPDHPAVATRLNDLALLYRAQGRYAQAEPLDKRALAIREKALG
ncbi:MAG: tetratricopeptide repeat protein, partial [Terriglobia bacterium]